MLTYAQHFIKQYIIILIQRRCYLYTHIIDKDTEIRGCHMTGKKSQHSTHKIEDLTIKLLSNEVNNLSLDSHHSEENQL